MNVTTLLFFIVIEFHRPIRSRSESNENALITLTYASESNVVYYQKSHEKKEELYVCHHHQHDRSSEAIYLETV